MSNNDPERLSSLKGVPELGEALRAARERLPDPSALAALRARVEAAATASTAPPATPSAANAAWPLAAKIIVPIVVLLGIAGGLRYLTNKPETKAISTPVWVAPAVSASTEPAPVQDAPPVATALPPVEARVPSARPSASASASASASEPAAPPEAPSELDLVSRAGRALKSNPTEALQLATEHAKLYPNGALSEEREVIAIESLAHLGNLPAARARAERFMVSYPRSAHISRVEHAAALDAKNIDAGDQKNSPGSALDQ